MDCPDHLAGPARDFWHRHWPRLCAANVVEEADVDSFAHLCRTHAILLLIDESEERVGTIKFVALSKLYANLLKQFALNPVERKRRGISLAPPEQDGFDL